MSADLAIQFKMATALLQNGAVDRASVNDFFWNVSSV